MTSSNRHAYTHKSLSDITGDVTLLQLSGPLGPLKTFVMITGVGARAPQGRENFFLGQIYRGKL